jgi:hypothetical protein
MLFTGLFSLALVQTVQSQDDLLNQLGNKEPADSELTIGTFNGTRMVNGHSTETLYRGSLEFIITHRFGTLNSGGFNLWGLDDASIRLGLEYGITDRLGVGMGRSSFDKTFDYYIKYKALQQSNHMPVTLRALGTASYNASMNVEFPTLTTQEKMSYVAQFLISRKFSSRLSLQVAPVYLHQATVDTDFAVNDLFSVGFGGRMKVTKSMSIIGEYYLRVNENANTPYYDPIGVGVEFETGGHVFQLVFTNARGMVERSFLAETEGDFFKGDVHFGFNITRTFQLARNK